MTVLPTYNFLLVNCLVFQFVAIFHVGREEEEEGMKVYDVTSKSNLLFEATLKSKNHYACINIACSGVRALCPSSRIQENVHIRNTAKGDWLDYQGWPGRVTGSDQG